MNSIRDAYARCEQRSGDSSKLNIHIFAGLCGGTGSGAIVDVIVQTRKTFPNSYINVYAMIPEMNLPKADMDQGRYYQNGYAAINELNALQSGRWYPQDVTGNSLAHLYNDRIKGVANGVTIYSNVNENGLTVNSLTELPKVVSDYIFARIFLINEEDEINSDIIRAYNFENMDDFALEYDETANPDDKGHIPVARTKKVCSFGIKRVIYPELRPSDQSSVSGEKREAESAIIAFYNCLKAQVQKQIDDADQDMRYADRFFFDQSGSAIELLTEMNAAIHNLSSSIQIYSSMDFRNNRSFAASDDLDAVSESLSELLDRIDDMLIWIEQHGSNTELVYCPKNTKEIVSRLYFNGDERTILTSATLTNATSGSLEEQYSYFISNTGFPAGDRGCLSEPKPSPYPYDEHAMIYYCDDLPHPTREHEAFIEKGVERLLEILSISNGKALVLFTAKTDMEEVYSILSEKNLPYKILMQQPGSSQDKVLLEFKEDTNSVLLGTGAYWEGISIEGKSLSNVIIFRLPFPVPDPIIEYKCSVAKDALMDVRVPEMIIKLKQGIGRLIRNFTDTGIVCIIDRRLRDEPPERYHDITWDSLPIKNRTSSLDELRKFYEGLPSAKE